jgi:pimeloyl-ACP methyl ester carboxylesterase
MSAILLENDLVHFEVLGRGRPILFLHGWVGSWRYWIPTMQAVSISFRAYALDLWGFGDSAKSPQRYLLDQQVALVSSFMDQMGIGKVALVGHGLGAVVAVLFAHLYPELVDRVMAAAMPLDENLVDPRLRADGPEILADWLLGRSPSADAARTDAPKADPRAIKASLDNFQTIGFGRTVDRLSTACLLVHGQNDPAVTLPAVERIAGLPYPTHEIGFDQSGHFPMLDEASKFNRLLADFLALLQGESPRDLLLKEEWKRRVR